jgi:hypothetical protein
MKDVKTCMMMRGAADRLKEDFVRAVEEKIQENIFHKFHGHFFTELCLKNFVFGNCAHAGCRKCLRMNTK